MSQHRVLAQFSLAEAAALLSRLAPQFAATEKPASDDDSEQARELRAFRRAYTSLLHANINGQNQAKRESDRRARTKAGAQHTEKKESVQCE